MKMFTGKTVDGYMADLPPKERAALQRVRKAIKEAAPRAQEVISYGMPGYKLNGPLVYFAKQKSFLSLYGINRPMLLAMKELKKFEVKGTTIHFSPEYPLPAALVKKIVRARVKQNEERLKKKIKK